MTRPLAGAPTLLRALNARGILEALARRGALTRSDLMRETGLSRTAVAQVVRMLESRGAVVPAGTASRTRGPAAGRVTLHGGLGGAAAVHVSHHRAHAAVVDAHGTILAEEDHELDPRKDRAEEIAGLIATCARSARVDVRLVVLGVPGIVTADGSIRDDQGPDGGIFRNALAAHTGCSVQIENDVNLAALAEARSGAGRGLSAFALLMLEDGLGAGIVLDGMLHRGASGIAGEVGYLPQPPLPIAAPVLGDTVVADLALANGRDPAEPIVAHLAAAEAGDPAARRMVAEMARRLVIVAGSMALVLDPEAYVLAGHAVHPAFEAAVQRVAEEMGDLISLRFLVSAFGREATMVGALSEATASLREHLFASILTMEGRAR